MIHSRIFRDVLCVMAGFLLAGILGSSAPQQPTSIPFSDIEKLQVEVLLLKAAAAGKRSEPLQIAYQLAITEQQGYYSQLKSLGTEFLRVRGLSRSEWTPSWDTLTIEKVPSPTPKPAL